MNTSQTPTPRMQKHAGLAYSVRSCQPMFAEGVTLERELSAAQSQVEAMRGVIAEVLEDGLKTNIIEWREKAEQALANPPAIGEAEEIP